MKRKLSRRELFKVGGLAVLGFAGVIKLPSGSPHPDFRLVYHRKPLDFWHGFDRCKVQHEHCHEVEPDPWFTRPLHERELISQKPWALFIGTITTDTMTLHNGGWYEIDHVTREDEDAT